MSERDGSCPDCEWVGTPEEWVEHYCPTPAMTPDQLRAVIAALRAEVARMRPVVDAAVAWAEDCACSGPILDWEAGTFVVGKQADDCYPDANDCPHAVDLFDAIAALTTK